ncbi:uncharacterized protein LOC121397011 [Xenopus laevis]|uniref:Uncharacterized protein LOC121397011 n=1 Tax=Xenopus laevis TaxID=8355 RepID=A0A8J1LHR8_XENLA|nr:uncharacterized protein LOC121397011 [Xenopus laevis]
MPINLLELRAIRLALVNCASELRTQAIRVQCDNATAVAYINRQGGTRSKGELKEAEKIILWTERNLVQLSAIPGVSNVQADFLSRHQIDSGEWELHLEVFEDIVQKWGILQIELMACRADCKDHSFVARYRDLMADGIDATTQSFQPSLCVPTDSHATQGSREDTSIGSLVDSPLLAKKNLVSRPTKYVRGRVHPSTSQVGPTTARSHSSLQSNALQFNGLAIEESIWRKKGVSEEVIATLIPARKPVSVTIYHRIWSWCQEKNIDFETLSIPAILSFLQKGLDIGLQLNSLKVQISSLSLLFQHKIALDNTVQEFVQGVAHIVPPRRRPTPTWDLNVELAALMDPPFEPISPVDL